MKKTVSNKVPQKGRGVKSTRSYIKKSGISTRDVILDKASQLINRTGVVDFRIEALATSLDLSPGNITYHFPKKEDIVNSIWDQYLSNVTSITDQLLTPLLDFKQLFLFHRSSALKAVDKLGVAVYFYGDMGVLMQENEIYRQHVKEARSIFYESYKILIRNGYLQNIESELMRNLTFESQFLVLRWWFNHAINNTDNIEEITALTDKYMVMAIYPLVPYMTEKGKRQFESILEVLG